MIKKISLEKYFLGLSRDSLIYGLGNAVLKILALVTAPIFTRVFTPADYGIISLIASVISFLSLLMIFGMDSAVFVSFYEYKKERKEVISTAFWFLFSWGMFLVIIFSLFSGQLSEYIFKSASYTTLFLITFVTAFLNLLISLAKIVYRLEFKAKRFALIVTINALLATFLMILFVVYLKKGLIGYFEGQLIGTFLTMILALYLIRHNLKLSLSLKHLKEMWLFGAMIVPASMSFFIFDLSDRFFLNHYRTLSELGLYSIAINIASLVVFFSYALGQAWSPMVMNLYFSSKKIFETFVPRFFVYYLIFFFSLAVMLTLFGQEILRVLTTPKFYQASIAIPPLTIAMVFAASNQVTSLGINLKRKTKYLAFYTALAAALNIILNFILIPRYGIVGAGWATAASYFSLSVMYFIQSQKLIRLNLDSLRILKLIIISLGIILSAPIFWKYSPALNVIVKLMELIIFVIMLYLFGIIEKKELIYLKMYLKRFTKISRGRPS